MEENYNPIVCKHANKYGLTSYSLISHTSGSGTDLNFEKNVSVCMLCGEIKVSGYEQKDGKIHRYKDEFSIHLPEAVAAIVKNCNYMNKDYEWFKPFKNDII